VRHPQPALDRSAAHAKTKAAVEAVLPPEPHATAGLAKTFNALRKVLDYLERKGRGRLTDLMVDEAVEA
jgi:hypothetical protein